MVAYFFRLSKIKIYFNDWATKNLPGPPKCTRAFARYGHRLLTINFLTANTVILYGEHPFTYWQHRCGVHKFCWESEQDIRVQVYLGCIHCIQSLLKRTSKFEISNVMKVKNGDRQKVVNQTSYHCHYFATKNKNYFLLHTF